MLEVQQFHLKAEVNTSSRHPRDTDGGGDDDPQLRGIKRCRSLFSGPLTLSPILTMNNTNTIVWENRWRDFICSPSGPVGGGSLWSAKPRTVWNCCVSSEYAYISVSLPCHVPSYHQEHNPRQLVERNREKVKAHASSFQSLCSAGQGSVDKGRD